MNAAKRSDIEAYGKIAMGMTDILCIIHEERAKRREAHIESYADACNEMGFEGDDLDDIQEIHILAALAAHKPLEFAKRIGELMQELAWYYEQNKWSAN